MQISVSMLWRWIPVVVLSGCSALFPIPAQAATFDLSVDSSSGIALISVEGIIEPGDSAAFFDLSQQVDQAVIMLESPGGNVHDGLSIGAEIAYRGFNTLVGPGTGCHSICAIIWTSGRVRYMVPEAQISVHAAYRLVQDGALMPRAEESGQSNASIGAYLNELGLSREAINYFTYARPNEPLLPITPEIAQQLSIEVAVLEADGISAGEDRPTPRGIALQTSTLTGMATICSYLLGVEAEFYTEQAGSTWQRGHDLFGGEIFDPLLAQYVILVQDEIAAKGDLGWCLAAEEDMRLAGADTGILGPSFDCGRATTRTEQAICGSPILWTADRVVSNAYSFLRDNLAPDVAADLLSQQRLWLGHRDLCGTDESCLIDRYRSRLTDFGL